MPVDGHDMSWLHMLKPSSMSNRKSDSNCILVFEDGGGSVLSKLSACCSVTRLTLTDQNEILQCHVSEA